MQLSASEENGKLLVEVKGLELPVANAIRRYAMSHVPVLAIEKITMYENSSQLFDEYLAHRIGLLPIKTPKGLPASAEITFTLDEVGPKKVYAVNLKSSDAGISVAEPGIPIGTLFEEQALRLEGVATLGTGREHAKHQAGVVSYEDKEDGTLVIKAESFLSMSAKEMLLRGCDVLEKELAALSKEVSKLGGKKPAKEAKKTKKKK